MPTKKVLNPKIGRCVKLKINSKKTNKKALSGKVLWDVKKQGIMLAHTFKDPKTGKVKSAPKGISQAPNGWFMSEKFDGYRALGMVKILGRVLVIYLKLQII